jgi:15-cis-phytoene synthase
MQRDSSEQQSVFGWEQRLLAKALVPSDTGIRSQTMFSDQAQRHQAYAVCREIAKEHSHTFYLTSGLLPSPQRQAIRALYAFCRHTDDLVDRSDDPAGRPARLTRWREQILSGQPEIGDDVALAWLETRAAYGIPAAYVAQFLDGVACDLTPGRYETFDDLAQYCYGVAATVGLMVMYVIGFRGPEAIPSAVKLGVALQMTNVLRDVGEDWRNGRCYLPLDELAAYDLSESDLAAGQVDERWRAFMRYQIARTRQLYAEALPGVAFLERRGRLAIAAAGELYAAILEDIEAHDYDVFRRRAFVSDHKKLARLPGIWWRARRGERAEIGE